MEWGKSVSRLRFPGNSSPAGIQLVVRQVMWRLAGHTNGCVLVCVCVYLSAWWWAAVCGLLACPSTQPRPAGCALTPDGRAPRSRPETEPQGLRCSGSDAQTPSAKTHIKIYSIYCVKSSKTSYFILFLVYFLIFLHSRRRPCQTHLLLIYSSISGLFFYTFSHLIYFTFSPSSSTLISSGERSMQIFAAMVLCVCVCVSLNLCHHV